MNAVDDKALERFDVKIFRMSHRGKESASTPSILPGPCDGIGDGGFVGIDRTTDHEFDGILWRKLGFRPIKPGANMEFLVDAGEDRVAALRRVDKNICAGFVAVMRVSGCATPAWRCAES